jgi:hypothetical protein
MNYKKHLINSFHLKTERKHVGLNVVLTQMPILAIGDLPQKNPSS